MGAVSCESKEPCIRSGPDRPREGALLKRYVLAHCNVLTHECIAHCSPAAAGECACPADGCIHLCQKFRGDKTLKTAMRPFARLLWTPVYCTVLERVYIYISLHVCSLEGRFPTDGNHVASGMSCLYNVRFLPDAMCDYDDALTVETLTTPPMIIPIQARRPPPVLTRECRPIVTTYSAFLRKAP